MFKLYITKKRFWLEQTGYVIEEPVWEQFLVDLESRSFNQIYRIENPTFRRRLKRTQHLFQFVDGNIEVSIQDQKTVPLALEVAISLNANVQGAFGEVYYFDPELKIRHIWPELGLPDPAQYWDEARRNQAAYKQLSMIVVGLCMFVGLIVGLAMSYNKYRDATPQHFTRTLQSPEHLMNAERDLREAVRRGEAGDAFQRLYATDHAEYEKLAKEGDPNVRPLGENVYEYQVRKSKEKSIAKPR